ncbi:hypothetical protein NKI20_00350 [Mesorhizobium sp. M0830]|uniref:hypothetical protein n=1 Tax=Mesorhizobium sp. M0830 TaxID=2957008 RepID=UPI0033388CAD
MTDLFDSDVLLSVAELQRRMKDLQEWQAQITALQKQVAETQEWINLVAKVIGPERANQLIGDVPVLTQVRALNEAIPSTVRQRPGGVTWTSFIENYVNSVNRPVDYAELREAISNSILGSKLEKSEKSFYGAIGKLTDSLRIVKEDGWIFSVADYNEYKRKVSKGENEPLPPSSSEQHARGSRIGDQIKRFLKTQTDGATGRQIIEHVLQIQEFQEVIERNNTNVYNVLYRLAKRQELRKVGTTYYSPEAPPIENRGSELETAVASESSASRLSSPAGRDADPRHTDVVNDQHASGGDPLTSTIYVGVDPAAVPLEVPSTKPSPTKSLFQAGPAAAPPEIPPPTTRSLFQAGPAAAPPEVQIQQLDHAAETEH